MRVADWGDLPKAVVGEGGVSTVSVRDENRSLHERLMPHESCNI